MLSVWGSNWLFIFCILYLLRLQYSDLIICLRLDLVVFYILYFIFAQASIQWPDRCYLSEAQFGCLYFVAVINSRPGLHWPTKPPKQKPNAAFKCNSSSVCLYNHNCACYLYFKPKWNQNETSILWWFQKFTTKQVFGEGCWVSLVVSLTDEECLQLVCYGH